jgi:exosome complex component RRP45
MLHDTTLIEEQCREGEIIISLNRFGEVCQIAKFGGTPIDGVSILACTNAVLEKAKMLDKLVRTKLEEDEKHRNVGGLMAELSAENDR